ncbi:MAG: hypothetical protein V3G42_13020 [Oscillospiraceae bacterium]
MKQSEKLQLESRGQCDKYLARCIRTLKSLNAPLKDWTCSEVIDVREDNPNASLEKCELCGYPHVRYIHVMEHKNYPACLNAGCNCAGVMESDILNAKEQERLVRNRSQRKKRFMRRNWRQQSTDVYTRRYKKQALKITVNNGFYEVCVNGRCVCAYKQSPIVTMRIAKLVAFNLVDPVPKNNHSQNN